jgi:hypothetical protein
VPRGKASVGSPSLLFRAPQPPHGPRQLAAATKPVADAEEGPSDKLIIDEVEMDIISDRIRFQRLAIADLGDKSYGEIISPLQFNDRRVETTQLS